MSSRLRTRYAITRFPTPVPCPYACGAVFRSSLQLAHHVLTYHNFANPRQKVPG